MRKSRLAIAFLTAVSVSMQSGQAQPHKHVTTHAKGSASLHHVIAHSASVGGRGRGRATLRTVSTRGVPVGHGVVERPTAASRRLSSAFIASATLRPMAQQLLTSHSAAAYNGVLGYAAAHPGEAAAAANLAIGHAYALDHRYSDAESAFHTAAGAGEALSDYAEYLGAQAAIFAGRPNEAIPVLEHFAERHPDSLFVPEAPVLLASAYLSAKDPADALHVLQPLAGGAAGGSTGGHLDVRSSLAKAYQANGNVDAAAGLYRSIYLGDPLSNEAANAKAQLAAMNVPLTAGERKQHADAMFNVKQYNEAAVEHRALEKNDGSLTQADRDALEI